VIGAAFVTTPLEASIASFLAQPTGSRNREGEAMNERPMIDSGSRPPSPSEEEDNRMSVAENAGPQMLSSSSWKVDPVHSALEFRVRHMMIETVKGRFRDFEGAIVPNEVPSISGSIRVASLDTLDERRDEHLRSPDFFDVDRFPEIGFQASGIELDGGDRRFVVSGELTIKGVTRPIELDGELHGTGVHPDGSERIAFELRGKLDRADFGLVWNRVLETGGVLVGNTVELVLDVSAVRVV